MRVLLYSIRIYFCLLNFSNLMHCYLNFVRVCGAGIKVWVSYIFGKHCIAALRSHPHVLLLKKNVFTSFCVSKAGVCRFVLVKG